MHRLPSRLQVGCCMHGSAAPLLVCNQCEHRPAGSCVRMYRGRRKREDVLLSRDDFALRRDRANQEMDYLDGREGNLSDQLKKLRQQDSGSYEPPWPPSQMSPRFPAFRTRNSTLIFFASLI